MQEKKGQVSKVFVFVFSVIIVLFAAFMVVNFIGAFMSDSEQIYEQKFFEQIEQNYDSVLKTYGSEKVYEYKVSSKIKAVCFVSDKGCIDSLNMIDNDISETGKDTLKQLFDAGDNVIIFDDEDVLSSKNIGSFTVKDSGCFCIEPNSQGRFSVLIENVKNKVFIDAII